MEKKLQKIYVTYCNLLIAQDLWQVFFSNLVNNLSEGIHRIKDQIFVKGYGFLPFAKNV